MPALFDIKVIFFTLWDYPMSYLEFAGVVLGGLATWLVARNNVWTWPLGVVSTWLFFGLFYQIRLYPDMFLQVFFCITYLQGWWRWTHPKPGEADPDQTLRVSRMPVRQALLWTMGGLVATGLLGTFARNLHHWFPVVFSQPSAFPYLDSFTSVLSVAGTFLMIQKRLECWYVWLLADAVLTGIYVQKGVKFVAVEYAIYCLMAVYGLRNWNRVYRQQLGT